MGRKALQSTYIKSLAEKKNTREGKESLAKENEGKKEGEES